MKRLKGTRMTTPAHDSTSPIIIPEVCFGWRKPHVASLCSLGVGE
jgi:hypothetical protein